MKKGTILAGLLALTCSFTTFAQKAKTEDSSKATTNSKTTFAKNKFGDNWIISLGAGGQIIQASDDNKAYLKDRVTLAPTFSIAKFFAPTWGLRLQFTGGILHGFNDGKDGTYTKFNSGSTAYMGEGYVNTPGYPQYPSGKSVNMFTWDPQWNYMGFTLDRTYPNGTTVPADHHISQKADGSYEWDGAALGLLYMQHTEYVGANINFMFNLMATLKSYDPRRVFEITPFAGIGVYHAFSNLGTNPINAFGVNAGFDMRVNITKRFGMFAEANGIILPNGFDGQVGGRMSFEAVSQITGGLSYTIGKADWSVTEPTNYNLVDNINAQVNDLHAELAKTPPAPTPKAAPAPKPKVRFLPDPVFFRLDKSIIDQSEYSKIVKAANYLANHPDENVVVTGYADKKTATSAYNLKLSERRSKAVSQILIDRYGINPLRVSVDWSGDEIQPFKNNDWNRVVIFVLQKRVQ